MLIGRNFVIACLTTAVTTVLLGIVYPLAVTGLAQTFFPDKANGQLLYKNGTLVGSRLIGQPFSSPGYFRSRPSAAGAAGYDASASSGSNMGPTNREFIAIVRARVEAARLENSDVPVPIDLVTSSGSGLDPHISPDAAAFQVPRIARERGVPEAAVRTLVAESTEGRDWGVFGEARVNVLLLNLGLDARFQARSAQSSPAVKR